MKKTKILASLLALVLILSSLPVLSLTVSAETETVEQATDGKLMVPSKGIDADGINTYQELAYAIQNYDVDASAPEADRTIEVTGDIDFGGLLADNTAFGYLKDGMIIDGNGYAIKNFSVYYWRTRGMFYVDANAHFVIKNLDFGTIEAPVTVSMQSDDDWAYHGFIIGTGTYATKNHPISFDFENVDVYANVSLDYKSNQTTSRNGGMAIMIGEAKLAANSSFTNCNVYGSADYLRATTGQRHVSGFVSHVNTDVADVKLTFKNCTNNAILTGGSNCGGFIGNQEGNADIIFENCVNNGTISSAGTGAGGFIGQGYVGDATFNNCVNLAPITAAVDNASGFVGQALGNGTVTITNSINAANITTADGKDVSHFIIVNNGAKTVSVTNSYALTTATLTGTETAYEGNGTLADLTAVAAKMRELKMGYYVVENDAVVIDTKVPQLVGVQKKDVVVDDNGNGTFDIRFIAVIKNADLENYSKVGFTVDAECSNGESFSNDFNSTTVFTSLNASVDGTQKSYKAYELGGDYIIAIAWTGVPASAVAEGATEASPLTVKFTVNPYAVNTDETTEYTGLSYEFTYVNGVKSETNA